MSALGMRRWVFLLMCFSVLSLLFVSCSSNRRIKGQIISDGMADFREIDLAFFVIAENDTSVREGKALRPNADGMYIINDIPTWGNKIVFEFGSALRGNEWNSYVMAEENEIFEISKKKVTMLKPLHIFPKISIESAKDEPIDIRSKPLRWNCTVRDIDIFKAQISKKMNSYIYITYYEFFIKDKQEFSMKDLQNAKIIQQVGEVSDGNAFLIAHSPLESGYYAVQIFGYFKSEEAYILLTRSDFVGILL
jgi:hypothetical protein